MSLFTLIVVVGVVSGTRRIRTLISLDGNLKFYASDSDSDNLVFTRSSAERKRWSRKRSRKKMETFGFFRLRFRRSYDSAYDSNF